MKTVLSNGSFVLLGVIDEIILEGKSVHKPSGEFKKDKTFINGLSDYQLHIREHIKVRDSVTAPIDHSALSSLEYSVRYFCAYKTLQLLLYVLG